MKHLHYLLLAVGMMIIACNDPVEVGSELLDKESLLVKVDSIFPQSQIVIPDSTLTFVRDVVNDRFANSVYMIGDITDPEFGSVEAICYLSVDLVSPFPDEMHEKTIDSVVVSIPFDTLGRYGPDQVDHEISLFLMTEPFGLEEEERLYSFDAYAYEMNPLFDQVINVDHKDTLVINNHIQDTAGLAVEPQLRLALDPQYWADFFEDNQDAITAEQVEELIPGFALTATSSENSLIGLDVEYPSRGVLTIFYTDTIRKIHSLPLGKLRHNQYVHDYAGSMIEAQMGNDDPEDLYIQSQSGADIEMDLSELKNSQNLILNSATLQLTVIEDENPELNPAPTSLLIKYIDENDQEQLILDILSNQTRYGGQIREVTQGGDDIRTYTMDLSEHIGAYLRGEITTDEITIYANGKAHRPNRVKLGGPNHPEYPATFKIIGTLP